jgi:signal-transduction protein with cAMP-binding, CBS, and nucleotidyltransferase domain
VAVTSGTRHEAAIAATAAVRLLLFQLTRIPYPQPTVAEMIAAGPDRLPSPQSISYCFDMSGVEDLIKQVPLFAGLSKRDLRNLAAAMKERTFEAGKVITEPGETGMGFFVIDSGTATVTAGGGHHNVLKRGDFFGEISLIDGGPRTARIVADTELKCYALTAWEFRPFVQHHPEVAWSLLTTLAQRVREAERRALN